MNATTLETQHNIGTAQLDAERKAVIFKITAAGYLTIADTTQNQRHSFTLKEHPRSPSHSHETEHNESTMAMTAIEK